MPWRTLAATIMAALAASSPAAGSEAGRFNGAGISFEYPSSWFVTRAPLSNAVNPAYRFTVSTVPIRPRDDEGPCLPQLARQLDGADALVYLREALGGDRALSLPQMQPRPRAFRLPAPADNALCGFGPGGRWIPFKQKGRAFYLGVYLGPRATNRTARELRRLIDGMEIRVR